MDYSIITSEYTKALDAEAASVKAVEGIMNGYFYFQELKAVNYR